MDLNIPIYVESYKPPGQPAPLFVCRGLFIEGPAAQATQLNRAVNELVKQLKRRLEALAREPRHDDFLAAIFCPEVDDHRLDLAFDLRSGWQRCRLSVVTFRALGRRLAFSPSLPDVWFEAPAGETLQTCTNRVYERYFRQREREERDVAELLSSIALKGQAWVTTVELSVSLATLIKPKPEQALAALFGGDVADGTTELENVGRCLDWQFPDDLTRALGRDREVEELSRLLTMPERRPVLLVGPRQSGKTTVLHEYVHRTVARRKSPFKARHNVWLLSPQRLIAGMSYLGQWEQRLLAILKTARKRDHVLYFDDLVGAYRAGVSRDSKLCVADVLKTYVERGDVRVLAEMTPEKWQVWRERDRGFADLFHVIPIVETDERETLRILVSVLRGLEGRHRTRFAVEALPAAMELVRRYVRDAAFPGKAALFLEHVAAKYPSGEVTRDTIYQEFAAKTGLSASFSDRRQKLPRDEIVAALGREVIGQRQAIDAVADVVSIAKAQLNDPRRPLGSLLFVGPTGVGKTQLAKTLAAWLFGDAERLLRFDMNEFVAPGAAARLVGTFADPEGLLTSAVRRQPFCVVLLDEIEKAHADVFDLLLQVMGEGRLTDALGRTTDFGNAIVILTSNLGTRGAGAAVGFRSDASNDAPHFLRAVERFFRPEFFNRLDRIVPFDRLSRDEVRQIAELVIRGVLVREGLVRRKCVLEVEPQALDRVVEAGYHPTLGARALKREIERQLTQPVSLRLAATPPDASTVISLYPAPDGIAVEVQTLVEVQSASNRRRAEAAGDDLERCQQRLQAIQAMLARVETSWAGRRPSGTIEPGKIALEHYHYFLVKERAGQLRDDVERLAQELERPVRSTLPPAAVGPVRHKNLARWEQGGDRHLLRELAAVDDIHAYLREAFSAAPRFGQQLAHQVEQLEYQAALVEVISRFYSAANADAVMVISAQGQRQALANDLSRWYCDLFGEGLSLDCQMLELDDPLKAMVISGPHALRIAGVERGTHLFCPRHANLVPVPVWVLPVANSDAAATVAEFSGRRREWLRSLQDGSGRVDGNPYPLPQVVRIYNAEGPTFDLRSGLSVPGRPTPDDLQTFVLAALPLPPELVSFV
ncbi:MAG TPA: AAA family ATPase [Pirellulales bacterium]|nr:AAA family ATPase [Pirellulales bacterium]